MFTTVLTQLEKTLVALANLPDTIKGLQAEVADLQSRVAALESYLHPVDPPVPPASDSAI